MRLDGSIYRICGLAMYFTGLGTLVSVSPSLSSFLILLFFVLANSRSIMPEGFVLILLPMDEKGAILPMACDYSSLM